MSHGLSDIRWSATAGNGSVRQAWRYGQLHVEDLLPWRRQSPYPIAEDWVLASPTVGGKQAYWPDNLMKRYIKPVARKAGITQNIGWHTFRHSFGTLLKANGKMCRPYRSS